MGGLGSGRWYRWDAKAQVESYKPLDIRWLQRRGHLTPGTAGEVAWRNGAGEDRGFIQFVAREDALELHYRVWTDGKEWEPVDYDVLLTWTPCHFGGSRPWFICPGIVNGRPCLRRVAILYGGRYFLCRQCHRLAYETQHSGEADRARIKAQNIRRRLGGSPSLAAPLPMRPKGMHFRTYRKLIQELYWTEIESWTALTHVFAREDAMLERRFGQFPKRR